MNSKLAAVAGAVVVFAAIVVVVLVTQGGGEDNTDTETKPVVEIPSGDPPTELEVEDIVEGEGPAAEAGDNVTVDYVGVAYSTGEEFDSSWEGGQPFPPFPLGSGSVIPGWDEGLEGMKEGGRRELIIPPDLAYGAAGQPPAIGPDETLVFIVDMREIEKGTGAPPAAGAVPGAGAAGAGGGVPIDPATGQPVAP